jgi:hypothetical protein
MSGFRLCCSLNRKMEEQLLSEASVGWQRAKWHYIPQLRAFRNICCEDLKIDMSYVLYVFRIGLAAKD